MSLSIDEIRQRTSRARDLMRRSRQEGFAVGAFNIDNQETLRAICQAAQKTKAPVMVEVSANEAASLGGYENIRDLVDNYSQNYGVEMYINLDHAPTVEGCKQAIDAG
ncbi:class II fructose-bisphosphate aldolase, partial [TM7 phylum sp. oral taxon 356]